MRGDVTPERNNVKTCMAYCSIKKHDESNSEITKNLKRLSTESNHELMESQDENVDMIVQKRFPDFVVKIKIQYQVNAAYRSSIMKRRSSISKHYEDWFKVYELRSSHE
jgi:predicted RND superfamily exporter protein